MAEPTGCCIRGIDRLGIREKDNVLVIGAGPAGLTYIQLLRALGDHLIIATDIIESRLRWAEKFGADEVFDASDSALSKQILSATEYRGADVVIVASGSLKAIQSSFPLVRKGGKILLFGIPRQGSLFNCDASDLFIREIKLIPSYSTTEDEMKKALELMQNGKISLTEMITHRFSLAETAEAFRIAQDARTSLKIIIHD